MNLKLANDIASNVLQTVFLYQPYMSENGLKNKSISLSKTSIILSITDTYVFFSISIHPPLFI